MTSQNSKKKTSLKDSVNSVVHNESLRKAHIYLFNEQAIKFCNRKKNCKKV